ncbi:MAG: class I mannose-6-phosphate isomerase [Clostridia bacterium]|nr:class I mannose-6-phosphate isomerase [Clostridia bacterium]
MKPYPLFLKPVMKDYIWGGNRLHRQFGYPMPGARAAEAWVLSCRPDNCCAVCNGEAAGRYLDDVLRQWGQTQEFPLLIKLIDARDRLSLQVHPDDDYARAHENSAGKTEMWYVIDCAPDAKLVYGLKTAVDAETLRRAVEEDKLLPLCRKVTVRPGDVFFIRAGTLHAIGKGILLAEVQQNSDITYRVSDYGRLGADGKPRALHKQQALAVIRPEPEARRRPPAAPQVVPGGTTQPLVSCPFFTVRRVCAGQMTFGRADGFVSLLCLSGDGLLMWDGDSRPVRAGDSVYLPAGVTATLFGAAELLETTV